MDFDWSLLTSHSTDLWLAEHLSNVCCDGAWGQAEVEYWHLHHPRSPHQDWLSRVERACWGLLWPDSGVTVKEELCQPLRSFLSGLTFPFPFSPHQVDISIILWFDTDCNLIFELDLRSTMLSPRTVVDIFNKWLLFLALTVRLYGTKLSRAVNLQLYLKNHFSHKVYLAVIQIVSWFPNPQWLQ